MLLTVTIFYREKLHWEVKTEVLNVEVEHLPLDLPGWMTEKAKQTGLFRNHDVFHITVHKKELIAQAYLGDEDLCDESSAKKK